MDSTFDDGVGFRLANVVASRDIVIWETEFINPPSDPFHCPPSCLWVQHLDDGLVTRLRVFHPAAGTDRVVPGSRTGEDRKVTDSANF